MTSARPEEPAAFRGSERFKVIRLLGRGGMGVVYEAWDRVRNRRVALKTLLAVEPYALLSLKNEFRALQDLQHENLVALGELAEEGGQLFFTMELLDGVDLVRWIRGEALESASPDDTMPITFDVAAPLNDARRARAGGRAAAPRVPPARAAPDIDRLRAAFLQLARGLVALHAAHKVHRDIKPSNTLVTPTGRLVLLDFGLVHDIRDDAETRRRRGTVAYMAPEQALGRPVGPPADWYSVGVLLYQALTGSLPFRGTVDEVLAAKQTRDPRPVRAIAPDAPAELDALAMALLRRDPRRRPTGRDVLVRLGVRPDELPSERDELFVDREGELQALVVALGRVRDGEAVTVLLHGESGVGKSTVVRQFVEDLGRGALVLSGRCYERDSVPYKGVDGVIDSLSRALARLYDEEVTPLLPPRAGLLAQVFPVLRHVEALATPPREPEIVDPREMRPRAFGALRELLRRLAARAPLVLTVDDLQWTDDDGLALLAELLRPPGAPALLLVGTVRLAAGEEPHDAPALRKLSGRLPGELVHVHLPRLPAHAARELAAHLIDCTPEDPAAAAIADEADGHPFYIDELGRHRRRAAERPGAVPRLDDAIWARITALDDTARRLLVTVALAGVPISQGVAARAAEVDDDALADAVGRLRGARLMRSDGPAADDEVEPYHDRVREAVTAHVTGDDARRVHERLARALEAHGALDPELLAVQWRAAGAATRARGYLVRAADQAAVALAFDHAARLLRAAAELAEGAVDDDELLTLRARLGDALANGGRGAEAARAYMDALPLARGERAIELRRLAAEQLLRSGHIDEGLAVLDDVLEALRIRLPRSRAGVLAAIGWRALLVRLRGLDFRPRREEEVPATERARVDICWAASSVLSLADHLRGRAFGQHHLALAIRAGEPYRALRALALEAIQRAAVGGVRLAPRTRRVVARVRALADSDGRPHALGMATFTEGLTTYFEGGFEASTASFGEAEQIFRERCVGAAFETTTSQSWHANALAYLGRFDELERRMPSWIRWAVDRGDRYAATTLRTCYGNLLWLAQDDPDGLRRDLAGAMHLWSPRGFHVQHYYAAYALALADLYDGEPHRAYDRIAARVPDIRRSLLLRVCMTRIATHWLRGRCAVAAATTAPEPARHALLGAATSDARRLGRERTGWADPQAAALHAGIAAVRGELERARAGFAQAAAGFAAAGAPLHAACMRWRVGELTGGDEGTRAVAEARTWLRGAHVRRPERMVALLAPGLRA